MPSLPLKKIKQALACLLSAALILTSGPSWDFSSAARAGEKKKGPSYADAAAFFEKSLFKGPTDPMRRRLLRGGELTDLGRMLYDYYNGHDDRLKEHKETLDAFRGTEGAPADEASAAKEAQEKDKEVRDILKEVDEKFGGIEGAGSEDQFLLGTRLLAVLTGAAGKKEYTRMETPEGYLFVDESGPVYKMSKNMSCSDARWPPGRKPKVFSMKEYEEFKKDEEEKNTWRYWSCQVSQGVVYFNRELQKQQKKMNQSRPECDGRTLERIPEDGRYGYGMLRYSYCKQEENLSKLAAATRAYKAMHLSQLLGKQVMPDQLSDPRQAEKLLKSLEEDAADKELDDFDGVCGKVVRNYKELIDCRFEAQERHVKDARKLMAVYRKRVEAFKGREVVQEGDIRSLQAEEQVIQKYMSLAYFQSQRLQVVGQVESLGYELRPLNEKRTRFELAGVESNPAADALDGQMGQAPWIQKVFSETVKEVPWADSKKTRYREKARLIAERLKGLMNVFRKLEDDYEKLDPAQGMGVFQAALQSAQKALEEAGNDYTLYMTVPALAGALDHEDSGLTAGATKAGATVLSWIGIGGDGYLKDRKEASRYLDALAKAAELVIAGDLRGARQVLLNLDEDGSILKAYGAKTLAGAEEKDKDTRRLMAVFQKMQNVLADLTSVHKWTGWAINFIAWSVAIAVLGGVGGLLLRGVSGTLGFVGRGFKTAKQFKTLMGAKKLSRGLGYWTLGLPFRVAGGLARNASHNLARMRLVRSKTVLGKFGQRTVQAAAGNFTFQVLVGFYGGAVPILSEPFKDREKSPYSSVWEEAKVSAVESARWAAANPWVTLVGGAGVDRYSPKWTQSLADRGVVGNAWALGRKIFRVPPKEAAYQLAKSNFLKDAALITDGVAKYHLASLGLGLAGNTYSRVFQGGLDTHSIERRILRAEREGMRWMESPAWLMVPSRSMDPKEMETQQQFVRENALIEQYRKDGNLAELVNTGQGVLRAEPKPKGLQRFFSIGEFYAPKPDTHAPITIGDQARVELRLEVLETALRKTSGGKLRIGDVLAVREELRDKAGDLERKEVVETDSSGLLRDDHLGNTVDTLLTKAVREDPETAMRILTTEENGRVGEIVVDGDKKSEVASKLYNLKADRKLRLSDAASAKVEEVLGPHKETIDKDRAAGRELDARMDENRTPSEGAESYFRWQNERTLAWWENKGGKGEPKKAEGDTEAQKAKDPAVERDQRMTEQELFEEFRAEALRREARGELTEKEMRLIDAQLNYFRTIADRFQHLNTVGRVSESVRRILGGFTASLPPRPASGVEDKDRVGRLFVEVSRQAVEGWSSTSGRAAEQPAIDRHLQDPAKMSEYGLTLAQMREAYGLLREASRDGVLRDSVLKGIERKVLERGAKGREGEGRGPPLSAAEFKEIVVRELEAAKAAGPKSGTASPASDPMVEIADAQTQFANRLFTALERAPWLVRDAKGTNISGWRPQQILPIVQIVNAMILRQVTPNDAMSAGTLRDDADNDNYVHRIFQQAGTGVGKTLVMLEGLLPLAEALVKGLGKKIYILTVNSTLVAQLVNDKNAFGNIFTDLTIMSAEDYRAKIAEAKLEGRDFSDGHIVFLDEADEAAGQARLTVGQEIASIPKEGQALRSLKGTGDSILNEVLLGPRELGKKLEAQEHRRRGHVERMRLDKRTRAALKGNEARRARVLAELERLHVEGTEPREGAAPRTAEDVQKESRRLVAEYEALLKEDMRLLESGGRWEGGASAELKELGDALRDTAQALEGARSSEGARARGAAKEILRLAEVLEPKVEARRAEDAGRKSKRDGKGRAGRIWTPEDAAARARLEEVVKELDGDVPAARRAELSAEAGRLAEGLGLRLGKAFAQSMIEVADGAGGARGKAPSSLRAKELKAKANDVQNEAARLLDPRIRALEERLESIAQELETGPIEARRTQLLGEMAETLEKLGSVGLQPGERGLPDSDPHARKALEFSARLRAGDIPADLVQGARELMLGRRRAFAESLRNMATEQREALEPVRSDEAHVAGMRKIDSETGEMLKEWEALDQADKAQERRVRKHLAREAEILQAAETPEQARALWRRWESREKGREAKTRVERDAEGKETVRSKRRWWRRARIDPKQQADFEARVRESEKEAEGARAELGDIGKRIKAEFKERRSGWRARVKKLVERREALLAKAVSSESHLHRLYGMMEDDMRPIADSAQRIQNDEMILEGRMNGLRSVVEEGYRRDAAALEAREVGIRRGLDGLDSEIRGVEKALEKPGTTDVRGRLRRRLEALRREKAELENDPHFSPERISLEIRALEARLGELQSGELQSKVEESLGLPVAEDFEAALHAVKARLEFLRARAGEARELSGAEGASSQAQARRLALEGGLERVSAEISAREKSGASGDGLEALRGEKRALEVRRVEETKTRETMRKGYADVLRELARLRRTMKKDRAHLGSGFDAEHLGAKRKLVAAEERLLALEAEYMEKTSRAQELKVRLDRIKRAKDEEFRATADPKERAAKEKRFKERLKALEARLSERAKANARLYERAEKTRRELDLAREAAYKLERPKAARVLEGLSARMGEGSRARSPGWDFVRKSLGSQAESIRVDSKEAVRVLDKRLDRLTRRHAWRMFRIFMRDPFLNPATRAEMAWKAFASWLLPNGVKKSGSYVRTELISLAKGMFEDPSTIKCNGITGKVEVVFNGQWQPTMDTETRRFWELHYGADLTMPYSHEVESTINDIVTNPNTHVFGFSGTGSRPVKNHLGEYKFSIQGVGSGGLEDVGLLLRRGRADVFERDVRDALLKFMGVARAPSGTPIKDRRGRLIRTSMDREGLVLLSFADTRAVKEARQYLLRSGLVDASEIGMIFSDIVTLKNRPQAQVERQMNLEGLNTGRVRVILIDSRVGGRGLDLNFKGDRSGTPGAFRGYRKFEMLIVDPQKGPIEQAIQIKGRIDWGRIHKDSTRKIRFIMDSRTLMDDPIFMQRLEGHPFYRQMLSAASRRKAGERGGPVEADLSDVFAYVDALRAEGRQARLLEKWDWFLKDYMLPQHQNYLEYQRLVSSGVLKPDAVPYMINRQLRGLEHSGR